MPLTYKRSLRAATVATLALCFLLLAIAGSQGHGHARRQAELDEILFCRDQLQEALDAQRTAASAATPRRSLADAQSWTRAVREWAARLKWRIAAFSSTHAPASARENLVLRLSATILALAEQRFEDALRTINTQAEHLEPDEPGTPDRRAQILRARADAYYDSRNWSAALTQYREVLLRQPEQLTAAERVAACLYSLQQLDSALRSYADLAKRLHYRGRRLMVQLDHPRAAQDLNRAATIRLWLSEQGWPESPADLAQSFSSCASAFIELQNLGLAKVYLGHAIDIYSQLIRTGSRNDLAAELANNHARYAGVLLQLGESGEAIAHLGSAIDIVRPLVTQGRVELRTSLATSLAHRGVVRQAQGLTGPAAQDFEEAAEAHALMGEFNEAVKWQTKALDLAGDDKRRDAQLRLDHYRSGEPHRDSSKKGP